MGDSIDTTNQPNHSSPPSPNLSTTIPMVIYALYLANFVIPFTALIGVIIAYVNKSNETNFLQSHYQFQIRTFWIGLLYAIIGFILTMILIGWIILLFYAVWLIIRCVQGFKYLNNQQPIPNPTSWMFG
ncbi:Probable transmembrane protein [hydrothermal vent metagenome]|uniref:Probable transmembrane protein n=1 Tax=hydrothermal vent metagenome TaxID=652676 RepID=A0A3B0WCR9_9ZZZZ